MVFALQARRQPKKTRRGSNMKRRAFEDELGVQAPLGYFDPLGLSKDGDFGEFYRRREAELKNGRVAMYATIGYIIPEYFRFPGYLAPSEDVLFEDVPNGLRALGKATFPLRSYRYVDFAGRAGEVQILVGCLQLDKWQAVHPEQSTDEQAVHLEQSTDEPERQLADPEEVAELDVMGLCGWRRWVGGHSAATMNGRCDGDDNAWNVLQHELALGRQASQLESGQRMSRTQAGTATQRSMHDGLCTDGLWRSRPSGSPLPVSMTRSVRVCLLIQAHEDKLYAGPPNPTMLLDPCNALAEWKPVEWRESSKTTVFRFSREVLAAAPKIEGLTMEQLTPQAGIKTIPLSMKRLPDMYEAKSIEILDWEGMFHSGKKRVKWAKICQRTQGVFDVHLSG
ncbi:FCPE [Symbiodinium microadriaticum]|nr:FCPE [Symbiodinium microadriaticum]